MMSTMVFNVLFAGVLLLVLILLALIYYDY
jgi:hypothetical protein